MNYLKLKTESIASDQNICETCNGSGYGECSMFGPEPCCQCGGNGKKRDWPDYYDSPEETIGFDQWIS